MEFTRFTAAGYTWSVTDNRNAAEAGDMYRGLALITPVDADGNRLAEITINGATRRSVYLSARRHPAVGVQVSATSGDLTPKAARVIMAAAESACKDLPDLTPAEITTGMIADLEYQGRHVAYTAYRASAFRDANNETRETREAAAAAATAAFGAKLRDWLNIA